MKKLITILTLTLSLNSFSFEGKIFNEMVQDNKEEIKTQKLVEEIVSEIPEWDSQTIGKVKLYAPVIIKVANELNLNPKLLLSIAWAESHFSPEAKSYVGALGIMQVKPSTQKYIFKKRIKKVIKLKSFYTKMLTENSNISYKVLDNILAGALYIDYLVDKFDNDVQKAVVAYNEGPRNTYRLINRDVDLNAHRYYIKISNNLVAMN